jgi:hypothetical protein
VQSLAIDLTDLRRRLNNDNLNGGCGMMGRNTNAEDHKEIPQYDRQSFESEQAYLTWKDTQLCIVRRLINDRIPQYAGQEMLVPHSFDIIAGYKFLLEMFFM